MIKNSSYKPIGCKIFLLAMLFIMLISSVSAASWDNVKDYNASTKTYTITNALGLGETIAKVKLDTPSVNPVGLGYQKVFEMTFETFDDYTNAIQNIKFYNVKDKMKPIEIELDYKYLKITPHTEEVCIINNKTAEKKCENITSNSYEHFDYNGKDMLKGNITISGWTTTKQGDKIEWVGEYFGEKLDEWAYWDAGLTNGLQAYYSLNETTGNYSNSAPGYETSGYQLYNNSEVRGSTGAFLTSGVSTTLSGGGPKNTNLSYLNYTNIIANNPVTFCAWFNVSDLSGDETIVSKSLADGREVFALLVTSNTIRMRSCRVGTDAQVTSGANSIQANKWFFTCGISNVTGIYVFINGTLKGGLGITTNIYGTNAARLGIGIADYIGGTWAGFTGQIDEVMIWNRSLADTEITALFNSYNNVTRAGGLSFWDLEDFDPNITLNNPTEAQVFTGTSILFNCTPTDGVAVQNVSLIINSTYNITNTSVSNNTPVINTVVTGEGTYNWTCEVCDSIGQCTNATTGNFTIVLGSPVPYLISPIDTFNTTSQVDDFQINMTLDSIDWVNYTFTVWDSGDNIIRERAVINGTPDANCSEVQVGNNVTIDCINQAITADDEYKWNVYACGDADKCAWATANFTFEIDTTKPQIQIIHPTATNYTNNNSQLVNISVTEANPDKKWYNYNGTNYTYTTPVNVSFAQGWNTLWAYANDTFGNKNSTSVTFYIDSVAPVVTLNAPATMANLTTTSNQFNCTASDNLNLKNVSLIFNSTYNITNSTVVNNTVVVNTVPLADGFYNWTCNACDFTGLCSNATISNFSIDATLPQIQIIHPTATNYTNNNSQLVNISVTEANPDKKWYNYNGTNYTYTTPVNVSFGQGSHTLWAYANDTFGNENSTSVTFFVDTLAPQIVFDTPPTPVNVSNLTASYFEISAYQDGCTTYEYVNITLYVYNDTDIVSQYSGNGSCYYDGIVHNQKVTHNFTGLSDGTYYYNATGIDWYGNENASEIRVVNIDTIKPQFTILYPTTTVDYHKKNTNLTINFSIADANIDTCFYSYWSSFDVVFNCTQNLSINITTYKAPGEYSAYESDIVLWANDTFGNENYTIIPLDYRLFQTSEVYVNSTSEGLSNWFNMTFKTNGTGITIGNLTYNNTYYTGSIASSGSTYTISRKVSSPSVSEDVNISFLWNFTMADGWYYSKSSANQSVLNFGIDNCTDNNYTLYNFTIVDEQTQVELNESEIYVNATINIQLYSYGTSTLIAEYSTAFNGVNPFAICLSENLTGNYDAYLQTQYDAAGYDPEFYHIQNATIDYTDFNTSITLYDINESIGQEFKIIVKDSAYLPLADALVYVDRKYIDEGVFKTVEVPKTDNNGETVAHLQLNDAIYNFRVVKYGVTIATFNNVIAFCENPTYSECEINLNAFGSGLTVPNYTESVDFKFTLGYNETPRTVSSVFEVPSGTPGTILLNITKTDALGTSICTDTITSASGTLSCNVPATIGNATVIAKLYKDGTLVGQGSIKLDQKPSDIYGGVLVFFGLFLMITLIGAGMSDNPVYSIIFFMVGVILLMAMNLVANNGFIGATATVLWLLVAIIIVIIKGARRS